MNTVKKYKHLFGPVPSRRLGLSLGVDVVPYKTCTQDCLYCECGKTTDLTLARKEYINTEEVLDELNLFFQSEPVLDYITFSGAGEPMLNSGLFKIAEYIKTKFGGRKTALLTNGTLFHLPDVIEEFGVYKKYLDLIIPSLDAAKEETFVKINRPYKTLHLSDIVKGLKILSESFDGLIWLEIFIIPGINDSSEEIDNFVKILKQLKITKIQLNSLDRPPSYEGIQEADEHSLKKFTEAFSSALDIPVEKIGKFAGTISGDRKNKMLTEQLIRNMILRRPCTQDDLIRKLGISKKELNNYLKTLEKEGSLEKQKLSRGIFYRIKS